MARSGSSSKFVPVNLNNSYGQMLPQSNGVSSTSAGLGRSRSFSSSYGSMVSLSRSTRISSPSASASAQSRASKLAVPRPVNLPSLRREHSGNDPSIALVGSSGSSGWSKQSGDETVDSSAARSDAIKGDPSTWTNRPRPPAPDGSTQVADRNSLRQSAYSPPPHGDALIHGITVVPPVEKAVVFRGEDFPTLQAVAAPFSPSILPPRSQDSLSKQRDKRHDGLDEPKKLEQSSSDHVQQSNGYFDQQFQPAQPVQIQLRGTIPDRSGGGAYTRGPSPLVKQTPTSNWADDERETLPNFRLQESTLSEWTVSNDGFRGNWSMDHSTDTEFKRPAPRTGYSSRNDADPSMGMGSPYKATHVKGVDFNRGSLNGSARFEYEYKEGFDRMSNSTGRNDFLKRGWSFSGAEVSLNQDGRLINPNSVSEWDSRVNGRASFREGNSVRQDTTGRDMFSRKARPGLHYQEAGQGQESKFTKDVLIGRQGFLGGALSGPRIGRGPGFTYGESDGSLPSKLQPLMDFRREKRPSGLYGHVHDDDPFLEHGLRTRPTLMYTMQPRTKDTVKDDYRDPARESFEAELERVEKMLEQERQRAVEERERAFERARKEQEEQERLAREEEEMRLKLEEEAREASYREERWAEDAARKVEEARKAREEEKRMAELEEERRKEAARKKLLELEERMAKREVERKQEDARRTERISVLKGDVGMEHGDSSQSDDSNGRSHWKSGEIDEHDNERMSLMESLPLNASSLPSILKSPRLLPYSKEENGAVAGARHAEAWKKEDLASGQEGYSGHLRNDRRQRVQEDRQWGPSFRTASVSKSAMPAEHSRSNMDLDGADDQNWWVRDSPNKSSDLLAAYPQSADSSDYPSYGRLRHSLPRQPRVLPPPPGPTTFRKQFPQHDDSHSGASTIDNECIEVPPTPKEGYSSTKSDESTHAGIKNILVTNTQASEQFESLPSEEVVLSDAGSQFSDDTAEDVYQEQELHSDAVSETYTEGDVDEISDLTEAQESSEDGESQKPSDWEASTGELKSEKDGESFEQARKVNLGSIEEETDAGKAGSTTFNEKEEEGTVVDEFEDSEKNVTSSLVGEKVGRANRDGSACVRDESEKTAFRQSLEPAGFKDGQEKAGNAEELAPEKVEQDEEVEFFPYQAPLLPVRTGDATQLRHFEDLSLRQSLVQQFQQPFSFMAVPLPQSSTSNHVGASVPMVTPIHGLPNQQELSFHLPLGLLPGMPLMPNAIQIGSIQMPLHIHPPIPPIAAVHGQQTPVFQFGQIGPSLSINQPLPMTHNMPQPAVHMHHAIGQVRVTQNHQAQADCYSAIDSTNDSLDLSRDAKFGNTASADDASLLSTGCTDVNENAEVMLGASASIEGPTITSERKVESVLEEPETQCDAVSPVSLSELDAQTCQITSTEDPFEDGDREHVDLKARPGMRPSRGGRRRIKAPPYQGILGRGRGRFRGGGQNYFYQAPHLTAEIGPEARPKRAVRGKMVQRNYRRAEYRVRERPTTLFDTEIAAAEVLPGPASNLEDAKESGGYPYVKRGAGSALKNVGEEYPESVGLGSLAVQTTARGDQTVDQSALAQAVKTKGFPEKIGKERGEDPPFRTGVVCVFHQPGIETLNDKDDFIKVRSKRQLLRELKEQREKESNVKVIDSGSRDQLGKKQQRPAKPGISSGVAGANSNKHAVKRRPMRSAESATTDGKPDAPSLINSATSISSSAGVAKRTLTSPTPGRAASASNSVTTVAKIGGNFAHDNQNCEQSTTSAWGGQRSNQEVVSLTQIQLEEAMKPFRLDAPFSESTHLSETALASLELGSRGSSGLAVEKTVITSGPLSSLLAGEKIQFGAVTSPTPIPEKSNSAPPFSGIRTGSPLGFGSDSPHIPSHSDSFVTNFLESDSACKDDGFEGLEAEAEAAASAVVAAAISSEDSIENSNTIVSEKNTGCTSVTCGLLAAANTRTTQIQNTPLSENQMAVALPADLSVETSQSLFQGSPMSMSNLSAMMLQSLPTGAPAFPRLEMGPLIGGPMFNFSPREDAPLSSLEPVLSGWQQRPMGTPDSFYGAASFLSPASIQGHPHMLVYTNPYTSVGQFGQLGVSFMGAATYHPSGKQPDWTHIPLSSTSSGSMGLTGDLGSTSSGVGTSQHLFGPSSLGPAQRTAVPGSSVMPVVAAPNVFDASLGAPFQVPRMDGYVQSYWSKAPAPPAHNVPTSGPSLPIQNMPLSIPPLDLNMQIHPSMVFPNHQMAHSVPVVESSSRFHQPPVSNPVSSSSFLSAGADAQFPDELGLGDSMPTVVTSSGDAGSLVPEAGRSISLSSEPTEIKMQRGRRPARSSQGHLSGANGSTSVESDPAAPIGQDQSRSGYIPPESQNKTLGRVGTPSVRAHSWQFTEQRVAFKQALPREGAGSEWPRTSQKRGASGRVSTSDKGAAALPSKLKQIYVAKPVMDVRKLSAACS